MNDVIKKILNKEIKNEIGWYTEEVNTKNNITVGLHDKINEEIIQELYDTYINQYKALRKKVLDTYDKKVVEFVEDVHDQIAEIKLILEDNERTNQLSKKQKTKYIDIIAEFKELDTPREVNKWIKDNSPKKKNFILTFINQVSKL